MSRDLVLRLLYVAIPLVAVSLTLATGYLVSDGTSYGFPFQWRTQIRLCPLAVADYPADFVYAKCLVSTTYNLLYLLMDSVFYASIGYASLLARDEFKKTTLGLRPFIMQLLVGWEGLARPFQVSAAMGVLAGSYLVYYLPPWLIIQSWLTGVVFNGGLYSMFRWAEYAPFYFMIPLIPIAGAICLVATRMSDERRGILALFLTVYSFIPVLLLGFQVLYWILRLWQIMIIALFWTTLLVIATRVLRSRKTRQF